MKNGYDVYLDTMRRVALRQIANDLPTESICRRGHQCEDCQMMTTHRYIGEQTHLSGVAHFWRCEDCGTTVALDSPEEFARRCFKRETRRMRQRRTARRYG